MTGITPFYLIEVNGRTVGTFRIVRYIMGVRFSGVSVKRGSTVTDKMLGPDGVRYRGVSLYHISSIGLRGL